MKKLHTIFASIAIVLASIGVSANAIFTTTFYVGNVNETGAHCRWVVGNPAPCQTGDQCSKVGTVNEITGRYYFSYVIDSGNCTVLPGAVL